MTKFISFFTYSELKKSQILISGMSQRNQARLLLSLEELALVFIQTNSLVGVPKRRPLHWMVSWPL
jgi:hypothetical protein